MFHALFFKAETKNSKAGHFGKKFWLSSRKYDSGCSSRETCLFFLVLNLYNNNSWWRTFNTFFLLMNTIVKICSIIAKICFNDNITLFAHYYVAYFFDQWMFLYFQRKLRESCQSFQILYGETLLISLSCCWELSESADTALKKN